MRGIEFKDGGYEIFYKKNNQFKNYKFGYYSNGHPSGESYRIEIFEDTINVNVFH